MGEEDRRNILDKLEPIKLTKVKSEASSASPPSADPQDRRIGPNWGSKKWFALDVAAFAMWSYATLRLLVGDVDRWVVSAVAPGLQWLLDYRFFGILLLASLLLIVMRKRKFWIPLYVVFFPLVVLLWKVPRALKRRGSWTLTLGVVHILVTTVQSFKYALIAGTVAAFCFLGIAASSSTPILIAAGVGLLALWFASLYKAFRYAFAPARFVIAQRQMLSRWLASKAFIGLVTPDEKWHDPAIEKFDSEVGQQVMTKAGIGLLSYRVSQFWAYRLDVYRRSNFAVVFSALSVVGLVMQALITFTFLNVAVFKIDSAQYDAVGSTGYLMFAYYSFASLFVSEVSAIAPVGSVAAGLQIMAGFSIAVLLFILVVTLYFGIKQSKADESANDAIREMRERGDEFAGVLSKMYERPIEEIFARLSYLGWDLLGVMGYLSRNIPEPPLYERGR